MPAEVRVVQLLPQLRTPVEQILFLLVQHDTVGFVAGFGRDAVGGADPVRMLIDHLGLLGLGQARPPIVDLFGAVAERPFEAGRVALSYVDDLAVLGAIEDGGQFPVDLSRSLEDPVDIVGEFAAYLSALGLDRLDPVIRHIRADTVVGDAAVVADAEVVHPGQLIGVALLALQRADVVGRPVQSSGHGTGLVAKRFNILRDLAASRARPWRHRRASLPDSRR